VCGKKVSVNIGKVRYTVNDGEAVPARRET
jgi:hypothetical protein